MKPEDFDRKFAKGMERLMLGQWLLFMQNEGAWMYKRPIGAEPERLTCEQVFAMRDRFIAEWQRDEKQSVAVNK